MSLYLIQDFLSKPSWCSPCGSCHESRTLLLLNRFPTIFCHIRTLHDLHDFVVCNMGRLGGHDRLVRNSTIIGPRAQVQTLAYLPWCSPNWWRLGCVETSIARRHSMPKFRGNCCCLRSPSYNTKKRLTEKSLSPNHFMPLLSEFVW